MVHFFEGIFLELAEQRGVVEVPILLLREEAVEVVQDFSDPPHQAALDEAWMLLQERLGYAELAEGHRLHHGIRVGPVGLIVHRDF